VVTWAGVWRARGGGGLQLCTPGATLVVLGDKPAGRPSGVHTGGVAERLKAPVLKTGSPQGLVGSNPTPSVHFQSLSVRAAAVRDRTRLGLQTFVLRCTPSSVVPDETTATRLTRREDLRDAIAEEEVRLARLESERADAQSHLARLRAELASFEGDTESKVSPPATINASRAPKTRDEKVALFRSLFRGRLDVFPTRFATRLWGAR
jgi:hypothetical protein